MGWFVVWVFGFRFGIDFGFVGDYLMTVVVGGVTVLPLSRVMTHCLPLSCAWGFAWAPEMWG